MRSIVDGKKVEAGGPDGKNQFSGTLLELDSLVDLSHVSPSVDILRNDADRAQMQEQVPARLVSSIRLWNGPRFLHGEASRKHIYAIPGSSQTT